PDAVDALVLAGGDEVVDQLGGRRRVPTGVDTFGAGNHLDVRVLLQRHVEADVAVVVGRVAGEAPHVVDDTFAAQLLEQPLGAEIGVLHLVVVQVVGVLVGHVGVDRHGDDAGGGRLL